MGKSVGYEKFQFFWINETPKMGLIGCPEISVGNYNYSQPYNSEEGVTQLLSGGSLKSRNRVLF